MSEHGADREMTLKEYVDQLIKSHSAHKEYMEMVRRCKFLNALEAAGVDNWNGYEQAQEMME